MLRLLLAIPVALVKLVLNIVFLLPMLLYKIVIDHKANVLLFSSKKKPA
jgi:hypothetical protein